MEEPNANHLKCYVYRGIFSLMNSLGLVWKPAFSAVIFSSYFTAPNLFSGDDDEEDDDLFGAPKKKAVPATAPKAQPKPEVEKVTSTV